MLVNDSIYLLDETMKKLQEMREIEQLMAKAEEWNKLSHEEQEEKKKNLRQNGN